MPLHKRAMDFNYTVDPVMIDRWLSILPQSVIEDCSNPAVAVGRPLVCILSNQLEIMLIISFPVEAPAARLGHLPIEIGPGDFQGIGNGLHLESSFLGKGGRNKRFFRGLFELCP